MGTERARPAAARAASAASPRWGAASDRDETARFLQGPQPRGFELARACRIFFELMRGFRQFHFLGPCVTVFGSSRFGSDHRYYALGRDIGARLAA